METTTGTCADCSTVSRDRGVTRLMACGCSIHGQGTLPSPWHVHYCPMHAAAPEMHEALRDMICKPCETTSGVHPWCDRALSILAKIDGQG